MRRFALLSITLALAACSPSAPTDTVDSLAADPERPKELRKQCKTDRAKLGDALCNAVAEATRRRFIGDGVTPYTPAPAAPKQ